MVEIKPFGSWPSPVSGDSLSGGISAADIVVDRQVVYWCEVVPAEQGRGQIFYRAPGNAQPTPLLPLEFNCRTRVHEYGGGSFTVKNGLVVFSNNNDGRLYTANLTNGGGDNVDIKPLTPDTGSLKRYGDMRIDDDGHYVVCVEEEHFENEQPKDVVNRLVSVSLKDGAVHVLAEGNDFYTSPRLFGSRIAYITYNHSNMPWDFTMLYLADFAGSSLKSSTCIAANDESVVVCVCVCIGRGAVCLYLTVCYILCSNPNLDWMGHCILHRIVLDSGICIATMTTRSSFCCRVLWNKNSQVLVGH